MNPKKEEGRHRPRGSDGRNPTLCRTYLWDTQSSQPDTPEHSAPRPTHLAPDLSWGYICTHSPCGTGGRWRGHRFPERRKKKEPIKGPAVTSSVPPPALKEGPGSAQHPGPPGPLTCPSSWRLEDSAESWVFPAGGAGMVEGEGGWQARLAEGPGLTAGRADSGGGTPEASHPGCPSLLPVPRVDPPGRPGVCQQRWESGSSPCAVLLP